MAEHQVRDRGGLTLRELAEHRVTELKAVGDKLRSGLAEMGIETVLDLLEHYPRRYVDRTERAEIHELEIGQEATVDAEVRAIHARRTRDRKRTIVNATVYDGTGLLEIVFFNQAWRERQLRPGTQVSLFGKVESYRGKRQMTNPVVDVLADPDAGSDVTGTIVPVYPQSGKAEVHTWQLRRAVASCLERTKARGFADPLDDRLRAAHDLVDRGSAYRNIHRPETMADRYAAANRLKFDEFLRMQLALVARKRALAAEATGIEHVTDGALVPAFHAALPFPLTDDQVSAIAQIADDMARPAPMHRLLQGEVGSGKTVVALRAMLAAIDAGGQAALLAPTEVLAAQHHRSIIAMLGDLAQGGMLGGSEFGTTVALLTGSQNAATRRRSLLDAASGEAGIVVGTHALIQKHVQFADLALVVVDEQHRFGVEQRDALREKGIRPPHVLVMTATPIPRTVAMTVFGDMETSTLRELPRGRSPITTHVVDADRPGWVDRTWLRVAEEVAKGHQAYVVCPRIGDVDDEAALAPGSGATSRDTSDEDAGWETHWEGDEGEVEGDAPERELTGVYAMLSTLRANPALDGTRIGVLHGRLDPDAKDATMRAFGDGEIDVLVATTVIEVGVDVPNASVMVVVDADRFGISQLHQLRGRVGRGAVPGLCLLMTQGAGERAAERLDQVAATTDGFELARADLLLRREGDVLGARQSGRGNSVRHLRLGRLEDEQIIADAREDAFALVDADPGLREHPALAAAVAMRLDEEQAVWLERG